MQLNTRVTKGAHNLDGRVCRLVVCDDHLQVGKALRQYVLDGLRNKPLSVPGRDADCNYQIRRDPGCLITTILNSNAQGRRDNASPFLRPME